MATWAPSDVIADIPMGLGELGGAQLIFKRKFRWTFELQYCSGTKSVAKDFVKVGSRPNFEIEEKQIDYLHGRMWIPGKVSWQTINVTYYDVAGAASGSVDVSSIFSWIASIYDITDPTNLFMGSIPTNYEGQAKIVLYDGCGTPIEWWLLNHVWPTGVNFGDLDMESSDECTVELTLRYSEVYYTSLCPAGSIAACACTPCEEL